jgi:RNA-dependent RNA polymerase
MKLFVSRLHFGFMVTPNSFMPMHTAKPFQRQDGSEIRSDVTFVVDVSRRRIETSFNVTFEDPRSKGYTDYSSTSAIGEFQRTNKFKFWIPFDQLEKIQRVKVKEGFALVITLNSPAQFFRKREEIRLCHSDENFMWSEFDAWFRQTDIVYDPFRLERAVVALHKERPVIDIGNSPISTPVIHLLIE